MKLEFPLWLENILADPISKNHVRKEHFSMNEGVLDARILLKNTRGYSDWAEGQLQYEQHAVQNQTASIDRYTAEISHDRPVYERFILNGRILDCGGGWGRYGSFSLMV